MLHWLQTPSTFLQFLQERDGEVDGLILEEGAALPDVLYTIQEEQIFLPAVLLCERDEPSVSDDAPLYHAAEVPIAPPALSKSAAALDLAIANFLQLQPQPTAQTPDLDLGLSNIANVELIGSASLQQQQHRLSDKLHARLGYLGVYYKRETKNFLRYQSPDEQEEFLSQLKEDYREIVLVYFSQESTLNQQIDALVDRAFFADISVTQVVEIHMSLMDEFSKQLQIEGRSEEILLDYRLTLIDVIAHLCEMYRRSIPREV